VAQWGKTLAIELGEYGICVNNVLPGYTSTARLQDLADSKAENLGVSTDEVYAQWKKNTSLKRLGTPEEIANTIVFLASDASAYVTGHNLSVDGGRFGA
jgi:3-oxoacyl-[acyl-carrier protein] reductase